LNHAVPKNQINTILPMIFHWYTIWYNLLTRKVQLSLEYLFYIGLYSRPTYTTAQYQRDKYGRCTYNVILRHARLTTLSMAKQ